MEFEKILASDNLKLKKRALKGYDHAIAKVDGRSVEDPIFSYFIWKTILGNTQGYSINETFSDLPAGYLHSNSHIRKVNRTPILKMPAVELVVIDDLELLINGVVGNYSLPAGIPTLSCDVGLHQVLSSTTSFSCKVEEIDFSEWNCESYSPSPLGYADVARKVKKAIKSILVSRRNLIKRSINKRIEKLFTFIYVLNDFFISITRHYYIYPSEEDSVTVNAVLVNSLFCNSFHLHSNTFSYEKEQKKGNY